MNSHSSGVEKITHAQIVKCREYCSQMKLSEVTFSHTKTLSYRVTVLFCCFWSVSCHVMTWLRLYWGLVTFVSLQKVTGKYRNTVCSTGDRSTWQFWCFGEHNNYAHNYYEIIFGNEERWVSHPPLLPPNIGRSYYM